MRINGAFISRAVCRLFRSIDRESCSCRSRGRALERRALSFLPLAGAATLASVSLLDAGQVTWLSQPFALHLTSEGEPLTETFVVELGAFAEGFTPNSGNTAEWARHWRVADRATYNPVDQVFGRTHRLPDNRAPFGMGERGYIWGYSTEGPSEWILMTDPGWDWPDAADRIAFPEQWLVTSAREVIVGQVDPQETSFFLQTQRILQSQSPRTTGDDWVLRVFDAAQRANAQISGWEQDPDGDGVSNLLEMAAGTDPLTVDIGTLPVVEVVKVGELPYLQLTFSRNAFVTLDYFVEVTGDFVNWGRGTDLLQTLMDTPSLLVVRDRTPLTFLNARFLRLTVQLSD